MSDSSWIKQNFVGQVLRERGNEMMQRQTAAMRKKLQFHTGHLVDDRSLKVEVGNGFDGCLTMTHPDYARYLDMRRRVLRDGVYKTRRLRIHNRFVMAAYYGIARDLMYGFTEEVKNGLRDLFSQD